MSYKIEIGAGTLEKILNEGLCCIVFEEDDYPGEGVPFEMLETNNDEPTGRSFFGRVVHEIQASQFGALLQFTLLPYMEDVNPETGKRERVPMMENSPNEKHDIAGKSGCFSVVVSGEKPAWFYRGVKWQAEIKPTSLAFDDSNPTEGLHPLTPIKVTLEVAGMGGTSHHVYTREAQK